MTRAALAAALIGALATPAGASSFWDRVAAPDEATEPSELDELIEAGALLGASARQHQYDASRARSPIDRREHRASMKKAADRAIALLEQAVELDPDNATLHYALGEYLYEFLYTYYDDDLPMHTKRDEIGLAAVEHWNRFEELSPLDPRRVDFIRAAYPMSPFAGQTSLVRYPYQFKRSIVYTKLGAAEHWQAAVADYDYCLAVAPAEAAPPDWTAQLLTNSAEILMALGELDEAIERYAASFDYEYDALYRYGLAVAYDRKGLTARSLDMMREAMETDRDGPMGALSRPGVFFIPSGDVHYYRALAHEARGDDTAALLHYREFLRVVKDTPYADVAKRHIEQLGDGAPKRRRRKSR